MVKYLNAELFKVRHRAYLPGFLAVIIGGISLLFLILVPNAGSEATAEDVVNFLPMFLNVGLYLVVAISDMVFSDQYKFNTLKNEVSFGLPRLQIYFGKLIMTAVLSVVLCMVILAYYLALSLIFFPLNGTLPQLLQGLGQALAQALPLWLGGLGLFHALLFLCRGSTAATVIYVLVVGVLNNVLDLVSLLASDLFDVLQTAKTWLLQTNFITDGLNIPHAWLVGMLWLVVATVVGAVAFQKREIN